jgi:hypothetical protein
MGAQSCLSDANGGHSAAPEAYAPLEKQSREREEREREREREQRKTI